MALQHVEQFAQRVPFTENASGTSPNSSANMPNSGTKLNGSC